MKRNRWILSALLTLAGLAGADPLVINLRSSVELAEQNNPSLQSSRLAQEQVSNSASQSAAQWQPTLSAGTKLGHEQSLNNDAYQTNWSANLTLSEQWSASTSANAAALQAKKNAGKKDISLLEEQLLVTVSKAYLHAVRDSQLLAFQSSQVDAQKDKLAQLQALVESGTHSQSEILQQKASLAQTQVKQLKARQAYLVSQKNLVVMIGLNPDSLTPTLAGIDSNQITRILALDSAQIYATESGDDLELQAQQARIEAARQSLRSSQRAYWPSFQLGASLVHSTPLLTNPATSTSKGSNESIQLSAQVQVAIFDQGERSLSVQNNRISLTASQVALRDKQNASENARAQARDLLFSSQASVLATRLGDQAAASALEEAQQRYTLGLTTLLEVKTAQADWESARTSSIEAEFQLWDAYLDWEYNLHRSHQAWERLVKEQGL